MPGAKYSGYVPKGEWKIRRRKRRDLPKWQVFDWAASLSDTELRVLCAWVGSMRFDRAFGETPAYTPDGGVHSALNLMLSERCDAAFGVTCDYVDAEDSVAMAQSRDLGTSVFRLNIALDKAMETLALPDGAATRRVVDEVKYHDMCELVTLVRDRGVDEEVLCSLAPSWSGTPDELVHCAALVAQ
jgi:hypothetical protein